MQEGWFQMFPVASAPAQQGRRLGSSPPVVLPKDRSRKRLSEYRSEERVDGYLYSNLRELLGQVDRRGE